MSKKIAARRSGPISLADLKRELAEVARIGQAFIDGDLCRRIYRPHGECFRNSDDIDFAPESCVPLKQTLMRLERLSRVPCVCSLWRRRPDLPAVGEPTLNGSAASPMHIYRPPMSGHEHLFNPPRMFPELAAAFRGRPAWKRTPGLGARLLAQRGFGTDLRGAGRKPAFIELFAPVKDSMGEVAAVLEVFTAVGWKG